MMEALIILVKWLSFEGMADLVDAVLEAPETFFPQEAPPDVFPSNQVGRLTTDAQFLARLGSRHQVTASLSDLHALDRSYTYCKDPCTSLALRNSHWDVVNRLISKGFRAYRTPDMRLDPLQIATRDGQHKTVTLMIQAGADFKAYMKGPRLEHPLMLAAANGHAKIISIILAMKIDGADSGLTEPHNVAPLLAAARRGHLDAVRELIKDVKVARIFEDCGDVTLHAGAQRTILDRKTDYGMTALMAAAQFGSLEIVKALVDAGASWKSTIDIDGNSALTHAIKNHHKNVAEWLINKGADIDSPNRFGLTPRELAGRLDTEPIICLLEKPSISTKSSSPKDRLAKPSDNIRARSEGSACSKMPWHSRIADDGTLKAALRGTEAPKPLTPTEYVSIRESANSDATSGVHSELESDSSSEFSHEDSDGASDAYSDEDFDGLKAVSGKNSQGRAPPMKRTLSVGDSNKASGDLEVMVAKREMGRAAPVRRPLSL